MQIVIRKYSKINIGGFISSSKTAYMKLSHMHIFYSKKTFKYTIVNVFNMEKKKEGFFKRRFYLFIELWNFMKVNKKWWLLPIVLMLLIVGALIIFAQASPLSPFIYALI